MIYLIIDYKDEGADPAKVTLPIRTFYMNKFKAIATHEIDPADWEALLAPVYDHTIKGFAINMPDTLTKVAKNFNIVVPSYPHPQRKGAFLKFKLRRCRRVLWPLPPSAAWPSKSKWIAARVRHGRVQQSNLRLHTMS